MTIPRYQPTLDEEMPEAISIYSGREWLTQALNTKRVEAIKRVYNVKTMPTPFGDAHFIQHPSLLEPIFLRKDHLTNPVDARTHINHELTMALLK